MDLMFRLSLELANLEKGEKVPQTLQKLLVDHNICTSGGLRPDNFVTSRDCKTKYYLSDPPAENVRPEGAVLPGDPGYFDGLWRTVVDVQEELIRVLSRFSEGRMIETSWLDEVFWSTANRKFFKSDGDEDWNPSCVAIALAENLSFYHVILRRAIVDIFLRGEGIGFKRIRRCPNCNKFFRARDLRMIFCGVSCKNDHFYKRARERQERELEGLRNITTSLREYDLERKKLSGGPKAEEVEPT